MRLLPLLSIFAIFILHWTSFSQNNAFKPKYSTVLNEANGRKLLSQCSRDTPQNIREYWVPTKSEIEDLENNYLKLKEIKSTGCCFDGIVISDLAKYCYQYIGVTIDDEKYLYINAFEFSSETDLNTNYEDWLTKPIIICDGGEGFWGVLYDIKKKKFLSLNVNGVV